MLCNVDISHLKVIKDLKGAESERNDLDLVSASEAAKVALGGLEDLVASPNTTHRVHTRKLVLLQELCSRAGPPRQVQSPEFLVVLGWHSCQISKND